MSTKDKFKTILLAEDDPDDVYLISEAIDECHLDVCVQVVQDGEELLDYLYQRGDFSDSAQHPRPDLILLDLNMPRKDGREALTEIKENLHLRGIPIVVLTTSKASEDLEHSYASGASGFVTKPVSFKELREIVCKLGVYWLNTVKLPDKDSHEGEKNESGA